MRSLGVILVEGNKAPRLAQPAVRDRLVLSLPHSLPPPPPSLPAPPQSDRPSDPPPPPIPLLASAGPQLPLPPLPAAFTDSAVGAVWLNAPDPLPLSPPHSTRPMTRLARNVWQLINLLKPGVVKRCSLPPRRYPPPPPHPNPIQLA